MFLLSILVVAAGLATAQVVQVGEEVEQTITTPHPYPAGSEQGEVVWRYTLSHPGASYIAVHFDRFELAPGDTLVLSDPSGRQHHVYRERGLAGRGGHFWGLSIFGETMELTLVSRQATPGAWGLEIDRWVHGFPEGQGPPEPDALCGAEDFRDMECYKDTYPEEYQKARAVVRLLKNGSAHCTGWLASCENHIITNEHCVGSQAELDQIEFQFEYKRPACGSGTASAELQLQGGTLLEVQAGLDYALILPDLAGQDPQATYGFLQIDNRLPDIGEVMYIAHHPSGDPKRLSIESTDSHDPSGRCEVFSTTEPACTGGPVDDVGYYCDTEGGSSGSPVLSAVSHRVIALHHCASCPNRGVPIRDVYNDIQNSAHPLPPCSTCDPGAPATALSATPDGDNRIALAWSGAADAVSYNIYRSTEGCSGTMTLIGSTSATDYLDDTVSGGVTYSYVVRAVNGCDAEAADSNCASASTTGGCIDPPLFDGLASATNEKASHCAIVLEWTPGSARCGSAVRYNIYRSLLPGFAPDAANRIATCVEGTTYRDTGLSNGTDYHYIVRAEDDSGDGAGPCGAGNEEGNTTERTAMPTGPDEVFYATGFEQNGGWTLEGEWQIGAPSARGGSADGGSGNADPATAFAGTGVLGSDLDGLGSQPGNYENSIAPAEYATSPAFDTTGRSQVFLRYRRWLGVERSRYDQATVEVFDANNWVEVWSNDDTSFSDNDWTPQDLDITGPAAGKPNARVRFGIASDGSVIYSGWNIDELELYSPGSCTDGLPGVSPVPDGHLAPGAAMTAAKAGAGEDVHLSWDVGTCPSQTYHLFHGKAADLPVYGYSGGVCGLNTSGDDTVPIPPPAAGSFTWWLLAGTEGTTEGHHGFRSEGSIRPATGVGLCGVLDHDASGTCP
ncbi:MAG: trypsin-like peptidase domain-containing protein [Acidobacteriota bacterium]|nr:trypsin-like peptidase domain-containing protein [Acidobacteriota bacterium]